MTPRVDAEVLSEWYELVTGDELVQGDILERCPIVMPSPDMTWPLPADEDEIPATLEEQDVVVMSQSCDLVSDRKSDMWLVILAPIWNLSEAAEANEFLKSSAGKEECRRGHMHGYCMLSGCDSDRWRSELRVVGFKDVWTLPLSFVREMAATKEHRPRLRSPYREHLAQGFARFFMRVGLPTDVPPFASSSAEKRAMQSLASLDEETRNNVIAAVTSQ